MLSECPTCGGRLQASIHTERCFTFTTDGRAEEQEHLNDPGLTPRLYCENDCYFKLPVETEDALVEAVRKAARLTEQ